MSPHNRDPGIDDYVQKVQQAMADDIKSDPLRGAIMDALVGSRDARVAAVRRKCSFDQLRAIVECVAEARPSLDAARREAIEAAAERLANAADDVGVRFFDTDTMEPEVAEMAAATTALRCALSPPVEGE